MIQPVCLQLRNCPVCPGSYAWCQKRPFGYRPPNASVRPFSVTQLRIRNGSSCPLRDLAGGLGSGRFGWLPALGTRGFHRPLSDPRADLRLRFHGSERDGRNVPFPDPILLLPTADHLRMNPKLRRQISQGLLPRKRRHRRSRLEFCAVLAPFYARLTPPWTGQALAYPAVQTSGVGAVWSGIRTVVSENGQVNPSRCQPAKLAAVPHAPSMHFWQDLEIRNQKHS